MLPCFFTKKFADGEHITVCAHIWEANIRDNWLLPVRGATIKRHDSPIPVTYEDGEQSFAAWEIHCMGCSKKDPRSVYMVEMVWKNHQLTLAPLAAREV